MKCVCYFVSLVRYVTKLNLSYEMFDLHEMSIVLFHLLFSVSNMNNSNGTIVFCSDDPISDISYFDVVFNSGVIFFDFSSKQKSVKLNI